MSAYQANVKVEQLAEGESARTPSSIGQQGKRPPTPSLPAGGAFTSSRPKAAATGAAPWAAKRSEQRGGAGGHPCKLVRAQRLSWLYWNGENQGEADDYRNENIPIRLIDLSHNKNDDV